GTQVRHLLLAGDTVGADFENRTRQGEGLGRGAGHAANEFIHGKCVLAQRKYRHKCVQTKAAIPAFRGQSPFSGRSKKPYRPICVKGRVYLKILGGLISSNYIRSTTDMLKIVIRRLP